VRAKIDTWPYVPRGSIRQGTKIDIKTILKEYGDGLSAASKNTACDIFCMLN
jgi:hypothetical protein